ncbi:hypothetical protein E4P42_00460 [Mycobacterium sp. PS03-16]|uniref:hypothetical protein n=1 Tax=Mycobacterium sp. PS03-16 TaxID=2559611 RepID=UPI0010743E0C|nr:hypothetical protein [Mycobacterium sp. PS03-16]TFV61409.1 hypothetical protein E4P42_00460 [Mycobacterium sp. PS03-16]
MSDEDKSPTVETGYEWLNERIGHAIERLTSVRVSDPSAILDDDRFFHPIHRTLSQDIAQCLLSALDHLRCLVLTLKTLDKPHPYAQATMIRTAITGAATALWMASASTRDERRCRAMEFMFNDLKSQLAWMKTTKTEPMHQQRPAAETATFDAWEADIERRLDWIVQQANSCLAPSIPFTRRTYGQRTTSDTDMVRAAGKLTTAIGTGGWDSELVLLNTWQMLSGYAHARPWAAPLGSTLIVRDPTPDPTTGTVTVAVEGNPDRLLDFAFRAVIVAEVGVMTLEELAR